MAKTGAERQRDYRQRLRESGFVEMRILVPANKQDQVRRFVERLRRTVDKS